LEYGQDFFRTLLLWWRGIDQAGIEIGCGECCSVLLAAHGIHSRGADISEMTIFTAALRIETIQQRLKCAISKAPKFMPAKAEIEPGNGP